jgi:transposase, IS6 family
VILNAIAEKLKRQSKEDFKGRHFEAWLIVQAGARSVTLAVKLRG